MVQMKSTGGHRCKVQSLLESVPFRGATTVPYRGGFRVPYNGDPL